MTAPMDLDLARAAVAMPGWRWMPGMLTAEREEEFRAGTASMWESCRILTADQEEVRVYWMVWPRWKGHESELQHGALPDYRDPATAGCLLGMLGHGWRVNVYADHVWIEFGDFDAGGDSIGEACIRAAIARGGWGRR